MTDYLIIDLEATCCSFNSFPREEMEIIEIGAVLMDSDLNIKSEFSTFIKPKLHPTLTDFCKELTTITQEDVDNAPDFKKAMMKLDEWVFMNSDNGYIFCSWGNYDKNQFQRDCSLNGVEYPFGHHINIKKRFANKRGGKPCGLGKALKKVGMTFEGTAHRGIDDARNMARLMRFMF